MQLSGRKLTLLASSLLTFLFLTQTSFASAKSIVKVISEGDSEANVRVKTETDTSSTTTSKSTGSTDIVIECNGVKKEYHSDKAENVTLNCDDEISGTVKSEVKVSSDTAPTTKVTSNPTQLEEIKKKTDEIKKEAKEAKEKLKQERKDLFEQMTQFFRDLFKNFHF